MLAYSLAAAKAELAKSAYPNGFKHQAADLRRRRRSGASSPRSSSRRWRRSNINVTINALDHAAFETTFQKYDYDMFIDYAINDISDPDEMASFELDYKDGGSKSYWSSYNNPTVITLVAPGRGASSTRPSARRSTRRSRRIVAQDAPFVAARLPALHLRRPRPRCRASRSTRAAPTGWRTSGWRDAPLPQLLRRHGGLLAGAARRDRRRGRDVPAAARRAGRPGPRRCSASTPRRARSRRCAISGGSTARCRSQFVALRRRPGHAASSATRTSTACSVDLADRPAHRR